MAICMPEHMDLRLYVRMDLCMYMRANIFIDDFCTCTKCIEFVKILQNGAYKKQKI